MEFTPRCWSIVLGTVEATQGDTGLDAKEDYLKVALESVRNEEEQLDRFLELATEQSAPFTSSRDVALPERGRAHESDTTAKWAHRNMYIRYSDITGLEMYEDDTIIGIKAPFGTNMEISDPDEGNQPGVKRYQMYLNSSKVSAGSKADTDGGPISVYLIRPLVLPGNESGPDEGGDTTRADNDRK